MRVARRMDCASNEFNPGMRSARDRPALTEQTLCVGKGQRPARSALEGRFQSARKPLADGPLSPTENRPLRRRRTTSSARCLQRSISNHDRRSNPSANDQPALAKRTDAASFPRLSHLSELLALVYSCPNPWKTHPSLVKGDIGTNRVPVAARQFDYTRRGPSDIRKISMRPAALSPLAAQRDRFAQKVRKPCFPYPSNIPGWSSPEGLKW
jgi:hypothetical protein